MGCAIVKIMNGMQERRTEDSLKHTQVHSRKGQFGALVILAIEIKFAC